MKNQAADSMCYRRDGSSTKVLRKRDDLGGRGIFLSPCPRDFTWGEDGRDRGWRFSPLSLSLSAHSSAVTAMATASSRSRSGGDRCRHVGRRHELGDTWRTYIFGIHGSAEAGPNGIRFSLDELDQLHCPASPSSSRPTMASCWILPFRFLTDKRQSHHPVLNITMLIQVIYQAIGLISFSRVAF